MKKWELDLGANKLENGKISFKVWAPLCNNIDLKILHENNNISTPMQKDINDYYYLETDKAVIGDKYYYIIDGEKKRPDPVSRLLPDSIHGPTEIIDKNEFLWNDKNWNGIKQSDLIFYEIHTGTFSTKGTFEGIINKLDYLKKLGITCIEIMPVNQFPGKRNWGYDGGSLYAVQNSYGGYTGLKKLVNECHKKNLAVCLDVVYNHLGPEGNYLAEFGPYFTDKYNTPWGWAINYDDKNSDKVREFFINNALYWIFEYHIDVLRLDAIHGIFDFSAYHILEELYDNVKKYTKDSKLNPIIIAESDLNDIKIIKSKQTGGYNLDGQWSDDFHHSLHTVLTKENSGYYMDFGKIEHLAKSLENAFVYDGIYSSFRKRRHGNSTAELRPLNFVIAAQNHDQIGNRALGDRLSKNISFNLQKVIPVILLLSPFIPLIFMGEEYGEISDFQYFVDHSDQNLIEAVRKGRLEEFKSFGWESIPDPKDENTYITSRLNWDRKNIEHNTQILKLYQDLIELRKLDNIENINFDSYKVYFSEKEKWIALEYLNESNNITGYIVSFNTETVKIKSPFKEKNLKIILHTDSKNYGGKIENKAAIIKGEYIIIAHQCSIVFSKI